MKFTLVFLSLVITLCLGLPFPSYADDLADLKAQMAVMQQQIDAQVRQMGEMQKKIEQLEAERAVPVQPAGSTDSDVSQRITAIEQKLDQPWPNGLLSLKKGQFEIGGELEMEFVDTQNDAAVSEPEPHFQLDKFVLSPKVKIADDVTLYGEIDMNQSSTAVSEVWLKFSELPLQSELKFGLDDRFIEMDRKTESYPLAGNAFWRDEEIGVTWSTGTKPFYTVLTVSQGEELDTKQVGEDNSYVMLHDNTLTSGYGGIKEVGLGVGHKSELGRIGNLNLLGFGYLDQLSDADIAYLKSNLSSYDSNKDDQWRAGINLDYRKDDFTFISQYIDAKDGDLDRSVWFVQPSYHFVLPFEWKYGRGQEILVRYGQYRLDTSRSFGKPATWDRDELTFALITDVVKNIKVKTEYSIYGEETGDGSVNNNELLMQLEVRF